jgi:hypothetical protein
VRPPALHHRVAKLEAAAEQASVPTVGATIAAILARREPRAPIPDEVLLQTRVGRLLLERRRRAALADQG